ncbi:MAG: hypothetical protein Q8S54_11645 [Bacteroidota bacterium]|nr:hypothetical protein [Odoribacter sp.]MDP3643829.1 hypothetical protein [Bacteroidota bacterium]
MKKQTLITVAFFTAMSISGQIFAQETTDAIMKTRTKSNNANENTVAANVPACVVTISGTETGCDIAFTYDVKSPRDAASGMATGKRMHKPYRFAVSSTDNSVSEIKSPRDVATGQSSGMRSAGNPIKGISVKGGKNPGGNQFNNLVVNNGQFTLPGDCPNGECDLILSWSWGESNTGSSKSYAQCHFILTMENGACMAIKTKGTGASNK